MIMSLPLSPPAEDTFGDTTLIMETATRILCAQGEAISALGQQFSDPDTSGNGPASLFCHSLSLIRQVVLCGGKVVFSGMGKSYKIGCKLVATLQSFGIPAASLHPSEALHGDVGLVSFKDIVVMISASGNSPELSALMRHLPEGCPTVCLTCNEKSPLANVSTGVIAAPLESHHQERAIYGLSAPTISTTMCLVIGDAMCVALYESLERDEKLRRANFARWHPGGAIGMANGIGDGATDEAAVIPWKNVPQLGESALSSANELNLWKSVALSPYICSGGMLYKSSDVIRALESGVSLNLLQGYPLNTAPCTRGNGLCIFRNSENEPTGVIWD